MTCSSKFCLRFCFSWWVGVGGFSKGVATFSHVDRSFNLFMATTGDVWIIPYFQVWDYVLHVEHIPCVITNCGQHQWVIPSLSIGLWALLEENATRKLLSLSLDLFVKILQFQVAFLLSFLPLSPSGWRGIVVTVRAGGCQTCRTHISVTSWRIFSIRSSVELSRPVVVQCDGHLPHMGLPMGQKLVKFATNWVQTLRNAYLWKC